MIELHFSNRVRLKQLLMNTTFSTELNASWNLFSPIDQVKQNLPTTLNWKTKQKKKFTWEVRWSSFCPFRILSY